MAWTATLASKTRDAAGRIVVRIDLADGERMDTMTLTTDTAPTSNKWLIEQVKARIAQLEALDAWAGSLPDVGFTVDITVDTNPTPAQVAEQQWIADYHLLKKMVSAVADGLILDTNAQLVALRNKVKSNFIAAYIDYVR